MVFMLSVYFLTENPQSEFFHKIHDVDFLKRGFGLVWELVNGINNSTLYSLFL